MSLRGLCSRREADAFIEKGWVEVDGVIIDRLGTKVNDNQQVRLLPLAKASQQAKLTVLLNKPVGFVSGTPEKDYKPAASLVTVKNCAHKPPAGFSGNKTLDSLAPAGRLDIDSQGLLVLTQDGRIARTLINPDSTIEKEYLVRIEGPVTEQKLARLRHGLMLDGRKLKPAKIRQINNEQLQFILSEGRKRQIRRMCELVDLEITRLQRVRIGKVRLGNLPPGKWRTLNPGEEF